MTGSEQRLAKIGYRPQEPVSPHFRPIFTPNQERRTKFLALQRRTALSMDGS